jgi:hypothetical protein
VKRKLSPSPELEKQAARFETIETIKHALDRSYQRMRDTAHRQWQRHFLHTFDPADACVTVRINNVRVRAIRGSGFLKAGKVSTRKSLSCPRFAH